MCGYIGKLSYNVINSASLNKNNERIECRGPDEKKSKDGVFDSLFGNKDKLNFHFIFNRLAIVDLGKNSSQPMINKDKNTILMFNGEIYNHKSLRTAMEKDGLKFYSDHSDSEVVLNGLTYYGMSFIDKMIGQFSIAFYDSDNRKLIILKDRVGQKPLFYSKSNSDVTFGSNLLSVAKESKNLDINKNSYNEYLNYGVVPSPNTIFNNVFKLKPGHFAEFTFENNKITSSFKKYWDLKDYVSDETFQVDRFNYLVSDSINLREQADVKVANFLSGGIDSSYIVQNMHERGREINTFSVVLEDEKYDERKYSREVSKKYQTNHTEIELGINDFKKYALESIANLDEPYADPSTIPSYVISKQISSKYKTSISGDGGDELVGGYKRTNYLFFKNTKYKSFIKYANAVYPNFLGTGNSFLKNSSNITNSIASYFSDKNLMSYLKLNDSRTFEENFVQNTNSKYKTILFAEYSFFLAEMMMLKVDRTSMAHSLEVRSPFVDHRLIEYMFKTKPEYLDYQNPKALLKKSLSKDFNENFLNRPKQGFVFNVEDWVYENKHLVLEVISENNKFDVFKIEKLEKLFKFQSRINGLRLWKIFLISLYINNNL